jgi:tRNA modification GTPase
MIPIQDTIAAIATAAGGGIGIIRLSGPDAIPITANHFTGLPTPARPRHAYHGWWRDADGHDLDEGLVIIMPGPASYTGEDVVELQLHGGALGLQRALEVCVRAGARPAGPGEFTRRAFLNGRIDLTRAEAIADLVDARTDQALQAARTHLRGDLEATCLRARERLLNLRARLEVTIDFIDEDVPVIDPAELEAEARALAGDLEDLAATYQRGRLWRQGARVVLSGPPNAGKSSLFNALCQQDRAIVTPTPGTTRDTLEATVDMRGVPVVLVDTAGLRETTDPVEMEGVQRARRAVDEADLTVRLLGSEPERPPDDELLVMSRIDLGLTPPPGALGVSAITGQGLDALVDAIVDRLGGRAEGGGRLVITRARHHAALLRAHESLSLSADGLRDDAPPELVAVDVAEATDALATIIGLTSIEDVLDRLFGAFCIGK